MGLMGPDIKLQSVTPFNFYIDRFIDLSVFCSRPTYLVLPIACGKKAHKLSE